MKISLSFLLVLLFAVPSALGQTSEAPASTPAAAISSNVAGTSPNPVTPDLDKLQSVASQANASIVRLHIDKWKANADVKSAAQANADSVQRNLTSALPGMIDAVRWAPDDVNATFKLYRNLNALYEVFGTLTEATRVFGQRSDYEALSQQLQGIGSVRRKLGEALVQSTASAQQQLNQMRAQLKTQQEQLAAAQADAAEARKQLLAAQNEPPKKPAPKKKSVAKKPAATVNTPNSSSTGQTGTVAPAPKS